MVKKNPKKVSICKSAQRQLEINGLKILEYLHLFVQLKREV